MNPQVFAFAKIPDDHARRKVYDEIKQGRSRFGMWDQNRSLRSEHYGANAFLLRIQTGDWIVHVHSPDYGKCVAVQVTGEYQFDEGIPVDWGEGRDFNNYIPVNPNSMIEFDRNDLNVLPAVNLAPRRRGQRILAVQDFLKSLENLRQNRKTKYFEGVDEFVNADSGTGEPFDKSSVLLALTDNIGAAVSDASKKSFRAQLVHLKKHLLFQKASPFQKQALVDLLAIAAFYQTAIVPIEGGGSFVNILNRTGAASLRVGKYNLNHEFADLAELTVDNFRSMLEISGIPENILTYTTLESFVSAAFKNYSGGAQ